MKSHDHREPKERISAVEIKPEMRIKILADSDVERIQQASLSILEECGIRFPSKKALMIFADGGARVDFKSQIVKIPQEMLIKALAKAPRSFTMASRSHPELDLCLDGNKTYYGTDGTGIKTLDLESQEERPSTKADVATMALISDYLSSVSFYWPLVSAQDMPAASIPLHELEASFTHTEKHVHIISCVEEKSAKYAVEMAQVTAGGNDLLRERPPLSLLVCTASPLSQDPGSVEAALVFAGAGLPVGFMAMPSMCSTAPASMAGDLVVGTAEILSALCLLQLSYPGTPVYYSLLAEMLNPHTGKFLAASIQKPLLNAAAVQVGHSYNLPVMGYYGSTDCRQIDWRTAKENTIDALLVCLTGPELLPAMGLLETCTLLRPEKILFDDEIFRSIKYITEGIRIDSVTLALQEIISVGPGGHFLDTEYTLRNLRQLWKPGVLHQWSPQSRDFRDPQEAAVEKTKWIIQNHKPVPLDEEVHKELKRIIETAEQESSSQLG